MNKECKKKTLDYIKQKWQEFEKAGLKEEAQEWKNKFYNLRDWENMNYSQYRRT